MPFLYLFLILLLGMPILFLLYLNLKSRRKIAGLAEFSGLNQHRLAEFRKRSSSPTTEKASMDMFIEIICGLFRPDAAVIYFHRKHGGKETIEMVSCSGIEASVFGESWDSSSRNDVMKNLERHFVFSSRPHLLSSGEIPSDIPRSFPFRPKTAVASVVKTANCSYYILLLRKEGGLNFSETECASLDFWSACMEKEILFISASKEKASMENALQKAHEEGMIQISSGIIHNIGNGLTVLQMQMKSLEHHKQIRELSDFLHREAIPVLQSHVKDGTLLEFLNNDPSGKAYLDVIGESLRQISELSSEHGEGLDKSLKMFSGILEVINLQHQFIGELGTENIVSIESVVRDAVIMSQPIITENRIALVQRIDSKSNLLVDPALLKHIIMLNIKYAIDSINKVSRSEPSISISCHEEVEEGRPWLILEIKDNGYGIDFTPEGSDQRSRDLRFCSERIVKYGGRYSVEFNQGYGSLITARMPVYISK